jgi:glycosyltransferase involved in cell wall biosynthesis
MKLVFVCWPFEDQGSGNIIQGYTEAARALGHEVTVYACPNEKIPLNYSLAVESADALVFLFEWTTRQYYGDRLDLARLVGTVPRERRIVVDGDGNYNDMLCIEGDSNHADDASSRRWREVCDSLSDKICQPTFHPLLPNVHPFLFYAYNPAWEQPLNFTAKEFTMLYVGNSKFRWKPMERLLRAIEPARSNIGRIGVVGHGWGAMPSWAAELQMEDAYFTDKTYLRRLGVDVLPPVHFKDVISWMSKAIFNPVLTRPTFGHMRLITPRLFETLAASTIPLFVLDEAYIAELYGSEALQLRLPDKQPEEKILDLVARPEHYAAIVGRIRRRLAEEHSHKTRVQRLIELIEY